MNNLLDFPQMKIKFYQGYLNNLLVVAGGRKPLKKWLEKVSTDKIIWCADSGLDCCADLKTWPQRVYGDRDSFAENSLQLMVEHQIEEFVFPVAKDKTDLQLLLSDLPVNSSVIVTGVWGGRFDHLYSNVFSISAVKKSKKINLILADEREVMVILAAGEHINCDFLEKPFAVSLLPLEKNNNVSIKGVKWNLEYSPLFLDNPYAISNEILDKKLEIKVHAGLIGCYFYFK